MKILRSKKGFTLIELVIVLAIAALILAGVLLAVGGAQKSRRDAQRKSDAGTYAAALETYATNNGGAYPANNTLLAASYFSKTDPSTGSAYTMAAAFTTTPAIGQFSYEVAEDCSGAVAGNNRVYALYVGLEQGTAFCTSNH